MSLDLSLINQPIFLVGAERSGTTVLRIMLRHHPKIAWCNEFEYAVDRISETGEWPNLHQYYDWLADHRIFLATGFEIDRALTCLLVTKNLLKPTQKPKTCYNSNNHNNRS